MSVYILFRLQLSNYTCHLKLMPLQCPTSIIVLIWMLRKSNVTLEYLLGDRKDERSYITIQRLLPITRMTHILICRPCKDIDLRWPS